MSSIPRIINQMKLSPPPDESNDMSGVANPTLTSTQDPPPISTAIALTTNALTNQELNAIALGEILRRASENLEASLSSIFCEFNKQLKSGSIRGELEKLSVHDMNFRILKFITGAANHMLLEAKKIVIDDMKSQARELGSYVLIEFLQTPSDIQDAELKETKLELEETKKELARMATELARMDAEKKMTEAKLAEMAGELARMDAEKKMTEAKLAETEEELATAEEELARMAVEAETETEYEVAIFNDALDVEFHDLYSNEVPVERHQNNSSTTNFNINALEFVPNQTNQTNLPNPTNLSTPNPTNLPNPPNLPTPTTYTAPTAHKQNRDAMFLIGLVTSEADRLASIGLQVVGINVWNTVLRKSATLTKHMNFVEIMLAVVDTNRTDEYRYAIFQLVENLRTVENVNRLATILQNLIQNDAELRN